MPLRELLKNSSGDLQREMQLILNALSEGICGVDRQGNATFCNEGLLSMTGYRAEELIGNGLHELLHHSHPDGSGYPEEECPLRKSLQSSKPLHIAREYIWRKDQHGIPVEYWVHPLPEGTAYAECLLIVQDVSERERAISALRKSDERFQQISNNIDQAFYLVDTIESRLVYASPAFETITGYSYADVCDKPSPWRDLALAEYRQALIADYERLIKGEETRSEYPILHHDGSLRWIKDHARPIRDTHGRVSMFAGVAEDITAMHEARETLHQNEIRFRRILSSLAEVAWTSDRDRRTIYISPKVETILGYTNEEIRAGGASFRSGLIHPEDFGRVNRSYKALFEEGRAFDEEYRIRRKDGSWIWIHDRATGIHEEGDVFYADGVFGDITRRKQAETELQWKTAFLEAQADSTIDGILVVDGSGQQLLHNRRFLELFDVTPELASSHDDRAMLKYAITLIRDPDSFMTKIEHLNKHPKETSRDEIELKNGIVIDRYSAPVIGKDGNYYGRIWAFRDITERKRAERELRLTKASLEGASATVFWIDPQAHIVYANQAACQSLGYSREELVSLSVADIDPTLARDAWNAFWRECKERRSITIDTQYKHKDGRIFPVEMTASHLEFDGQEYIFAFARDITQRRELETQLRQAHKLEAIGQLSAGIAHEINTPTQFVSDNLTFLRDSWKAAHDLIEFYRGAIRDSAAILPRKTREALAEAEQRLDLEFILSEAPHAIDQSLDGAQRVAKIVRAMREFAHPDSAEKTETDLNKAVESTITVARNEWKYVAEVQTELDESLPRVVCYPGDINQVILNLLVNAAHAIKEKIKGNEKGLITVRTHIRGDFAEISVTDSGTGIPEAIRNRVFDPFFTTKEVGKGTGQGLSLAHGVIVKKHSGRIWFETEIGKGTTFFIQLQARPGERNRDQ